MKLRDSYLARRRFLGGMLGGGAVALGSGVVGPLASYVGNLREDPPPAYQEIEAADWSLEPGTSKMLLYGRIPVLMIRTPDDELRIFVANCTHFDCPVGYKKDENRIFCGCHNGYYDVDGQVISGPPPERLQRFHWKIQDGKLIIALEKENLDKTPQEPRV